MTFKMGWFNSKSEDKKERNSASEIPELPELPELPSLPEMKGEEKNKGPRPLPSFSTESLERRFNQNAIKSAVSGGERKEASRRNVSFSTQRLPIPPSAPKRKLTQEIEEDGWDLPSKHPSIPEEFQEAAKKVKEAEPVFVRIDKFQESLKLFDKIRRELAEIESRLKEVKDLKEEESRELEQWQQEVLAIKGQIGQIDKDVFSKVD